MSERQNHRCCYCGHRFIRDLEGTFEHVIPLAHGGANDETNIVIACYSCNHEEGKKVIVHDIKSKIRIRRSIYDLPPREITSNKGEIL